MPVKRFMVNLVQTRTQEYAMEMRAGLLLP